MCDCLEASLHQLSVSLSRHGGFQTPSHRLESYIEERKDKQVCAHFNFNMIRNNLQNALYFDNLSAVT